MNKLLALPGSLNSLSNLVRFFLVNSVVSVECIIDHCRCFIFLPAILMDVFIKEI